MSTGTRWEQRYANFQKALSQLESAVDLEEYSDLERQGLIQCFEYTIELAWKTLQDLLEVKGYTDKGPNPVIKKAFQIGLIEDGTEWAEMLKSRNETTHTYNEAIALEISQKIKTDYFPLLDQLDKQLEKETEE
jgi:nucleotidyltransferase substrate binding protein (TIGR01987 family)